MSLKQPLRPGGRSARVQRSVHQAVHALLEEHERASLTVPMVAARAGVTPSTLYRRWGDLPTLLADVALARLQPDTPSADTGSLRGDLRAWAEQYLDEMCSTPGREMLIDIALGAQSQCQPRCAEILRGQLQELLDRASDRGQLLPDIEQLLDGLVAPVIYRLLFDQQPPPLASLYRAIDSALP